MNPNGTRAQHKPILPTGILDSRKTKIAALSTLPPTASYEAEASEKQPSSSSSDSDAHMSKSSSCGDSEGQVDLHLEDTPCPSHFCCGECSEVLHELSNVMTSVLTNSQLLGWKLPPYSHLKRWVRELERGAQRSGELLKRLRERCPERP